MTIDKPDILYYMLQCLNVLCLYGDAFNVAVKDHQGFFIWCQENLLIKKYVFYKYIYFLKHHINENKYIAKGKIVCDCNCVFNLLQFLGTIKRRAFAYSTSDRSIIITLRDITMRYRYFLAACTRRVSQFRLAR